jgi:hypothetical protein
MRPAAFLLLSAGWTIVIAALFLLHSGAALAVFVLSGFAVQILGLVLAIRSHRLLDLERG